MSPMSAAIEKISESHLFLMSTKEKKSMACSRAGAAFRKRQKTWVETEERG